MNYHAYTIIGLVTYIIGLLLWQAQTDPGTASSADTDGPTPDATYSVPTRTNTPTQVPSPTPTATATAVPPTVTPLPPLPTVPLPTVVVRPPSECPAVIVEVFGDALAPAACSVAWCESRYNPWATGAAGERGYFQIHPIHADSTYDPLGNTLAAWRISSGGTTWTAWAVVCRP